MNKIIVSVLALFVLAGPAFAGDNYFNSVKAEYVTAASQMKVGSSLEPASGFALDVVGNLKVSGNITASPTLTGNLTLVGNQSVSGSKAEVPSTSYSALAISSAISPVGVNFLVVSASGTLTSTATPFISTTTAISGQVITLFGGSANVLTLTDEGGLTGSLLELGSGTRAIGAGDILKLRYYSGKWYEEGFVNN